MKQTLPRTIYSLTTTVDKYKDRKVSKIPSWESMPMSWIAVYLSYYCTRTCPSCYIKAQGKHSGEMSDEMFEDFVEWVPKVYEESDKKQFLLIFLGGEPLLRTDRIKRVMDRIAKDSLPITGGIFTNGDLLDVVNWDDLRYLYSWHFNITDLSPQEYLRRAMIIKENSEALYLTNTCVLTDENILGTRVEEIVTIACENNFRCRFYRNMFEGNNQEYKERLIKKYHSILDVMEKYSSRGYHVSYDYVQDYILPQNWDKYPDIYSRYFCGRGVLSVRPDGSVGPCLRNHEVTAGTIYSEHPNQLMRNDNFRWAYKRPDAPQECKICDIKDICQSGCPNDKLATFGRFDTKSPFCEVYKSVIPRLMELRKKYSKRIKYEETK